MLSITLAPSGCPINDTVILKSYHRDPKRECDPECREEKHLESVRAGTS